MTTLKRRISIAAMTLTATALSASGLLVYVLARLVLSSDFDAELMERAQSLATAVEYDEESRSFEFHGSGSPAGSAFRIESAQGDVLAQGGDAGLLVADPRNAQPWSHAASDGTQVRQIGIPARAVIEGRPDHPQSPEIHVCAAMDTSPLDHDLRRLGLMLLGVTIGVTLCSGAVMAVIVGRAIAPLGRVANEIAAIDMRSLDRRLDPLGAPAELSPVLTRLNGLLDRLQAGVAKETAFNAAIAHELRTPIAGLITTLEVYAARDRSSEEYREGLDACARIAVQMRSMMDALLILARADANRLGTAPTAIAIAPFLRGAWPSLADDRVEVEWSLADDVAVIADPRLLSLIVRNVFDNAIAHGSGRVRIATERVGDRARIAVASSGCTLQPEQVARVFDRFWRAEESRSRTGEHFGLGLALCREAANAMGGVIAASVRDGWFTACIHMPAAGAPT